jgi:ferredoxin--NADP+ reductase
VRLSSLTGEKCVPCGNFFDEFNAILGANYIRCCTGEDTGGLFHGRVTRDLAEHPLPGSGLKYYLCGRAVEARDILIEKGVPFAQIISEIYF